MTHPVTQASPLLRASDKLMEGLRLVELLELATRDSPEDDSHAMNAGCYEAIYKLREAASILSDFRVDLRADRNETGAA